MKRPCVTPRCSALVDAGEAHCADHLAYLRANPRCEQCGGWAVSVVYRVPRTTPLQSESLCQRCFTTWLGEAFIGGEQSA
jgi:hypothetical protein